MKILFFILLISKISYAYKCEDFYYNNFKNATNHHEFIEQYERNIKWKFDPDNMQNYLFSLALEDACLHAVSRGINYELFDPYELVVLYKYTHDLYEYINSHLRLAKSADKSHNIDLVLDVLDRAITKFSIFNGLVKRGTYLPPSIDELYIKGNIVDDMAYISTSKIDAIPYTKYHTRSHQMLIHTCTGRDISKFSKYLDEEEVLIPRNTEFKVIERTFNNKQHILVLHELDLQGSLCK